MALPEFFQQFESDAKHVSEKMAHYYLEHLGLGNVRYEPDGQEGPDFVIDGRIAVEVRLLNEHVFDKTGSAKPKDQNGINLVNWIKNLITKSGPSSSKHSWRVDVIYSLSLKRTKQLEQIIAHVFKDLQGRPPLKSKTVRIIKSLSKPSNLEVHESDIPDEMFDSFESLVELTFVPVSRRSDTFFLMGFYGPAGGFVDELESFETNLRFVLKDKADKVRKRMGTYAAWWLLLVDKISYTTLSESELAYFREAFPQEALHPFKRVILLCGNEPRRGIDFLGS